jgi:hypothetical protein
VAGLRSFRSLSPFPLAVCALVVLAGSLAATAIAASQPSAPTAEPSSAAPAASRSHSAQVVNYVGSQACMGCHQASAHDFGATMMGNILIKHPRDEVEQHGCETCHGPGRPISQTAAFEPEPWNTEGNFLHLRFQIPTQLS